MFRRFEEIYKEQEEKEKIAQLSSNVKLKYFALSFISVSIVLLLIIVIWFDTLSPTVFHVLRGCAGLGAILFILVLAIYFYRINSIHNKQKYNKIK